MMSNNDIYSDFYHSRYIIYNLYWLIVDYNCQLIDNNKDEIIVIFFSICR